MKNPLFEEVQSFGRHGLWFAMVSLFVIVVFAFLQLSAMGINRLILIPLIPAIALFFYLIMYFKRMKLHIRADENALEFMFIPVQDQFQVIEWKFVDQVEVVQTSGIRRLAGWGVQFGPTRAYTIRGSEGVEISFPNGRKLFLGTERANELERIIRKYRNKAKRS